VTRYLPRYQRGAGLKGYGAGTAYTVAAYLDFLRRRWAYRLAARIAFASEGLRQVYRHVREFQDESRHRVVHAPVIEDQAVPNGLPSAVGAVKQSGAPIVLYVGKVSRGKGAELLAAVQRRLRERLPRAKLVIAGNIEDGRWGFDPDATLALGFQDAPALAALYQACDVVVLPSIWPEPLGWATLDAGWHAKPIVASRVGGIPEGVIDGETGILVDKLDVGGMCEALERLLRDPSQRREMGARARRFVLQRFGEAAVQRELEALYQGL
jgi:glycosyltransferase involved in cell wall biosynthesis